MSFLSVRQWQRKTSVRCLYKAGELASNRGDKAVREEHAREAEAVIERRRIERGIRDVGFDHTGSPHVECNRFSPELRGR